MCRSPRLSPSTTTHYPSGLEGESGAGVGGGGLPKKRKLDEKWREMQQLKYVFAHLSNPNGAD